MNVPSQCDVVVIGGGPAGSTAATALSQSGYDVVLLEKAKHPRFIVGESLIPHFWRYADLTKASEKIEAEGFVTKSGGTVAWNGKIRQMAFKNFGYDRPALHVERDRFDHILLQHAGSQGVSIFEETKVGNVQLNGTEGVTVVHRRSGEKMSGQIGCRFVIDASGQSTVIGRQLGIHELDAAFRFISLWGYFANSKYVASDGRAYPFASLRSVPPTTFVTSVGQWGWSWHIPMRPSTSVGFVLPVEQVKAVRAQEDHLEAYFLGLCESTPILSRLLEGAQYLEGSFHVIRDFSYRPAHVAGPGYFLVGDAAAFIDPIFSLGVTIAMYSASIAAAAIDRSFRKQENSDYYRAIYSTLFTGRYVTARALALPGTDQQIATGDLVKKQVKFFGSTEQELMAVVSILTNRSSNFKGISGDNGKMDIISNKYRELDEIAF